MTLMMNLLRHLYPPRRNRKLHQSNSNIIMISSSMYRSRAKPKQSDDESVEELTSEGDEPEESDDSGDE
jgi:hypothetical protein